MATVRAFSKDSVVATSNAMRLGRSARVQTTPPVDDTSPDCTPWVKTGLLPARLMAGMDRTVLAASPDARAERRVMRGEEMRKRDMGDIPLDGRCGAS